VSTDLTASIPPEPKPRLGQKGEAVKAGGITRPTAQRSISLPCLIPRIRRERETNMPGLLNMLISASCDSGDDSDPDSDTPDGQENPSGCADAWDEMEHIVPRYEHKPRMLGTVGRSESIP
jgi:hypothetical protein